MYIGRKRSTPEALLATASSCGTPSVVPSDIDTVVSQCPSPSEHIRQVLDEGVTVKEQQEHERHEAVGGGTITGADGQETYAARAAPLAIDSLQLALTDANTVFSAIAQEIPLLNQLGDLERCPLAITDSEEERPTRLARARHLAACADPIPENEMDAKLASLPDG
jgi:hypothetical protein